MKKSKIIKKCFLMALCAIFSTLSNANAVSYTYTSLDTGFYPTSINDVGTIVGVTGMGITSLNGGAYTTLDPSVRVAWAAINNAGTIVGEYVNTDVNAMNSWNAFELSGSTFTNLNQILSIPPYNFSQAYGINNNGTIVGNEANGFILTSGGAVTTLQNPLSNPPIALGINDAGTVVGYFNGGGGSGFILSNGTYTSLGYNYIPDGINDAGTIVGNMGSYGGGNGFILSNGIYNLLSYPGAALTQASSINNLGQIVGYYENASGAEYGFLATPVSDPSTVPEPSTIFLLGAGLAGLGLVRRWVKK